MNEKSHTMKFEKNKPIPGLSDYSRMVAGEGIVLLKNDNNLLPLKNKKISIFGRIQTHYYKSGTGSGGLVNVNHVTSILEGLQQNPLVSINNVLLSKYLKWIEDNPYNAGNGMWASEPWSQIEMPLDDDITHEAALNSEVAIIVIGRTAGEDRDNYKGEGSYLLRKEEVKMIETVSKHFKDIILVLNVGNIIDMSILDHCNISSVLYVWHGGMEGGRAVSDVLTGLVNPSGKLCDTIAYHLDDYPSTSNFGSNIKSIYQEDIYIGYRYFETFAKEKVRFPFGFGLSYTTFTITLLETKQSDDKVSFKIKVTNTGDFNGKEVVQLYFSAPQGKLGKPLKQLCAFAKTPLLNPLEDYYLTITIFTKDLASYDDSGITSYKSSYILEKGNYHFYLGNNVRDAKKVFVFNLLNDQIIKTLQEAMAPKTPFKRMKPIFNGDKYEIEYEDVPTREIDLKQRIIANRPKILIKKDNNKYKLIDVYNKLITLQQFVAQLNEEELSCIVRGEGMSSWKVTSGTAAAYGGVTDALKGYGIPVACASDGPSGIRMDSGQQATSLPNGTCIACTMNYDLIKELYYYEGKELEAYNIDTLLGPGMNIHRNPLNGRNFEYLSEDPLVTGIIGQAITAGLQHAGHTGTLKHMAANNQEHGRFDADSIISERALREIYLKGFEIAVRYGKAKAIMTSYNPINGIWAAGNYDMNSIIIHDEWGFDGVVVTDWWAKMNDDGDIGSKANVKAMVASQNDIYMVVGDSLSNPNGDNTLSSLKNGDLSLGELQRCAYNICKFMLQTPVFFRENNLKSQNNYQEEYLFEVDQKQFDLPTLDKIIINKKELELSPLVSTYRLVMDSEVNDLQIKCDEKLKTEIFDYKNKDVITIKVSNGKRENIYRILLIDKNKEVHYYPITDFSLIKRDFVNTITAGGWDSVLIDLTKPIYKSNNISLNEQGVIINCHRDELITYSLDVLAYGKYIIEMELTSHVNDLSQVPFSIFINNDNKSTLTMGATNGNWVKVNSHIIIEPGQHYLSLKFNKSGLEFRKIRVIKHN